VAIHVREHAPGLRRLFVLSLFLATLPGSSSLRAAETTVTEPEKVSRLVARIDSYHALFRARKYGESYGMLGSEWRSGGKDKQEWIRSCRRMDNGIQVLDWQVKQVWLHGHRAKVRMLIRSKTRETLFRWEEDSEESDDYWVYEAGDWYFIPLKLSDWDSSQAVEVTVPRTH